MNSFRKKVWILGIIPLFIISCHKEYFELDRLSTEIELEPEIAAPVIYGSVSMEDIIAFIDSAGYTETDEAGLIYLIYSDTLLEAMADTMIDVPDKLISRYYIESDITGDPNWGINVGETVHFYKTDTLDYGMEGISRLDSALLKGGMLVIDVLSEFRHGGELTISSDYVVDEQGNPFSTTFVISLCGEDYTGHREILMEGYHISTDLKVKPDSTITYIIVKYDLALTNSGNPIEVGQECSIDMSFQDMEFYSAYGFVEPREELNQSGEFEIPLYSERPELADIIFADPRINIYVNNSIGLPLEIELNDMTATSAIDGSLVELTFEGIHPFWIDAPGINQVGETIATEININNTTSNIDEFLACAPSYITYDIIGRTGYESLSDEHFVLDTSKIDMIVEFVLPLDFKTTGFSLQDTMDFELFGEEEVDTSLIQFLQIRLGTDNGLPIAFEVQVYFTDEYYTVIDSLFEGTVALLEAAPVDQNGIITSFQRAENFADIDSDKISNLMDVTYAIFHAKILTSNEGQDFVKIYSHYEGLGFEPAYALDFDLSIHGGFKLNPQETGDSL
ncbi:MAG: hypothetical protein JXA39_05625 [Bacteroidales bacterium]|nr:hypothetical protein [Bacteroidales bacterium]